MINISTEKAFDMLPHAAEMLEKLDIKNYILKNKLVVKDTKTREELIEEKGFDVVMHILKNSGNVKDEVFEIVAILQDKTVEQIKQQPFLETLSQFKALLQNKELMDFFKQAM